MVVKTIRKAKNLREKKVLYRADFNVPIKRGKITDEYKIISQLATIRFLLRYNCSIIIVSHLGRPNGTKRPELSLRPIAQRISELLDRPVEFIEYCKGFKITNQLASISRGEIVMIENIRFDPGEEANRAGLAREMAGWADIYVNDAFGVSHRAHASVAAIKRYLPSYAGLLLEKEVDNLYRVRKSAKPLMLLVGGAKIATKARMLKKFQRAADRILVGGAVANNFLLARGYNIGKSLVDAKSMNFIKHYPKDKLILPVDLVVSTNKQGLNTEVKKFNKVENGDYIFDIGPKTVGIYAALLKQARTIVWNGPMGLFEVKAFRHGTISLAKVVAARSGGRVFGVAGGGETVEALKQTKMIDHVDWVSTGGGAMLAFLGQSAMPGLKGIVR